MSAWPQIERCMTAQWRGYSPTIRGLMEEQWTYGGSPGSIGSAGHLMYNLWWVEHTRGNVHRVSCADLLMSIKIDLPPAWVIIDIKGPSA